MMRLDQAIALQQALGRFADVEEATLGTYNDALRLLRARKISEIQLAAIIQTKVLPPWKEQHDTLRALHLPADWTCTVTSSSKGCGCVRKDGS